MMIMKQVWSTVTTSWCTKPVIDVFSYSTTNGTHGGINFMKSRNNTVGTNTVITTGDVIGSIAVGGFDGSDSASIIHKE